MLFIKFENIKILNFSRIKKKQINQKKYCKKYSIRKSYNHFQNYFIGNILIILRNITFMSNVMITRYIWILEKREKMKSNNNCSFSRFKQKLSFAKNWFDNEMNSDEWRKYLLLIFVSMLMSTFTKKTQYHN